MMKKFFAQNSKTNTASIEDVIQRVIAKMNGMAEKENNDKENIFILNGYDTTVASRKSVIVENSERNI